VYAMTRVPGPRWDLLTWWTDVAAIKRWFRAVGNNKASCNGKLDEMSESCDNCSSVPLYNTAVWPPLRNVLGPIQGYTPKC
jgi:hypothetical protein